MAIDKTVSKMKEGSSNEERKHEINLDLLGIIKFRQARKWYISIAVVTLFAVILALMIYFMSNGVDVQGGWKEILLLMLGGFVGSFAKVIDFWFNNAEDDTKLLEHADD
jgi:uncharacterized membrane protein